MTGYHPTPSLTLLCAWVMKKTQEAQQPHPDRPDMLQTACPGMHWVAAIVAASAAACTLLWTDPDLCVCWNAITWAWQLLAA